MIAERVEAGHSKKMSRQSSSAGSILLPRLVLGALLLTAIVFPSLYEPFLSRSYQFLLDSPLYRLSCFETIETVFFYALIEILYTVKFIRNPHLRIDVRGQRYSINSAPDSAPKRPHMRRPSKRISEIIIYILPLLSMDLVLIKKYAGVPIAELRRIGGYVTGPVERNNTISLSFLKPTVHKFSVGSLVQLWRALPSQAPSSRRLVLELAVSFFIYDALFFFIHLAFHRIRVLNKYHQIHHRHGEIHPQVTNQLSVVERLCLVLLANFSLNIIGSHVLTRTAFVPIFVYLLVDIHSGLDLDWSYDKILPAGWGAGARKHAKHHRDGIDGLQPFFCWWDYCLDSLDQILADKKTLSGSGAK